MKKIILEILLGLGLPAAIFHTQLTKTFTAAKPVDKQITYTITGDSNYNSPVYSETVASIRVVAFTVQNQKQTIVYNRVYGALPVKQYFAGSKLRQTVQVKNVNDSKQQVFITYIITYNTKGSIIQVQNGTCLQKGEKTGNLTINI